MNELALFAGAGGGILGGKLLGWNTVCAVEWEQYPASILAQRQNDGLLPAFPIWDDIRTFDGRPWRWLVDVVSGGFPCQDISPARTNSGNSGNGLEGTKSGLWFEMLRVIREVEPRFVLVENSAHLRTKGLDVVLKGLAEAGYDAKWGVFSARDSGANHERKRMFIVAHSNHASKSNSTINDEAQGLPGIGKVSQESAYADRPQRQGRWVSRRGDTKDAHPRVGSWWKNTSYLDGMDDGVAYRMDRLKAIGNGQIPAVVKRVWESLV